MSIQVRHSDALESSLPPVQTLLPTHAIAPNVNVSTQEVYSNSSPVQELFATASSFARSGNWQEALKIYKRLVEVLPRPEFYSLIGGAYYKLNDFQRAATAYKKAIKMNPKDIESYFSLGFMYLLLGKNIKALQALREVIKINKDEGEAYFYLGYIYTLNHQLSLAIAAYRDAIRLNKEFEPAYLYLAKLYSDLGRSNEAQRNEFFSEAITIYRNLLEIDPKNSAAYNNVGVLYSWLKNSAAAIEEYKTAIDVKGDNLLAIFNLGALYIDLGYYKDAKHVFEQAIQAFSHLSGKEKEKVRNLMAHAYNGLGVALVYLYSSQPESKKDSELLQQACIAYRAAIELNSSYALAHSNLGGVYYALGCLRDAEIEFQRVLELDSSNEIAKQSIRSIKESQLKQRLFDLGYLERIPAPITDLAPYQNRRIIEVNGKPVSETLLEERR